jgi:hypothetical protein
MVVALESGSLSVEFAPLTARLATVLPTRFHQEPVYQISKMLCSVAASQERALKRRLTAHEQRLSNFSNQKNINKEAVMHDLEDTKTAIHKLEREITEWNDQFAKLVRSDRFNNDQAFQGRQVDYLKVLLEQRAQMINAETYEPLAKLKISKSPTKLLTHSGAIF